LRERPADKGCYGRKYSRKYLGKESYQGNCKNLIVNYYKKKEHYREGLSGMTWSFSCQPVRFKT